MRSRDHQELPGVCGGGVELDPHIEKGTLHRVAAHAAVAVPRQVGQPALGPRHLDHDTVPVETVTGIPQVGVSQCRNAEEPGVGARARRSGESRR